MGLTNPGTLDADLLLDIDSNGDEANEGSLINVHGQRYNLFAWITRSGWEPELRFEHT